MHYLGSKVKLIPFLRSSIEAVVGKEFKKSHFCDLFAGSGAVTEVFKESVGELTSNDKEFYSYILLRNMLRKKPLDGLEEAVERLFTCKKREGFIFKHYALGGGFERHYFSDENAQKIDALRQEIEQFRENETVYVCLLASLLHSAHHVANTASVYSAFLKKLKPLAKETLAFKPIIYPMITIPCNTFCEDANVLIERISGDVLYLDPPYNRRQYAANYHLLNTIASYDNIVPRGKTGVRMYESSRFCKEKTALSALEEIVSKAQFTTIFLSYNNEGLIPQETLIEMMKKYGAYTQFSHEHPRFKAPHKHGKNPKTMEFLHVLEKKG